MVHLCMHPEGTVFAFPHPSRNDRAKLFGAISRGGNISKKGPHKGVTFFGAFGGGFFRGAVGSDADDVWYI
jgi:hypothetical protein